MNESDIKTLENAGFTHAQVIIYLTLTELGQTKVGVIIEKTTLQSSVVHNNLNKLIEKGLVNFVLIGKTKHYKVAEPQVILNFLDEQKDQIEKQKEEFQKIIPRLQLLRKEKEQKTEVEVYKGRKGFKAAFIEETGKLPENGEYQYLAIPLEFQKDEKLHETFLQIDRIVSKKKCKIKGVGLIEVKPIWQKFYRGRKFYNFRYSDENFPWGLTIFKDSIIISMWGDEPINIKIKNQKFRDNALKYFESKWRSSKE